MEGELCLVEERGWKAVSVRFDRGNGTEEYCVKKKAYMEILDVSISDNDNEKVSQLLTPLAGHLTHLLDAKGWEICKFSGAVSQTETTGKVCITYMDMTTDTFGPDDTVLIR
jgi:hypothetical protein